MSHEIEYGTTRELPDVTQEQAIARVTEALKSEGFGILTTIDVRQTLKEKLGVATRPYVILGACNPALAHRALETEPGVGLLLPCNVTVFEREGGGSMVQAINPQAMFSVVKNKKLTDVVQEVSSKLKRAIERV